MSTTIELKYFNTFWLKKLKNVVDKNKTAGKPNPAVPAPPFANVPLSFASVPASDWYIEESRIRGGYNNLSVDFGVKAYIAEEYPQQQNRINTMIYSGIFNSRTGVNNTNQFSVAESITRSVDPAHGSIQRLYAEDTNLIIFQEDKVSRALIDKDAIYSAEGGVITTAGSRVIGGIVPFAGEYGISKDPQSFAVYGYRKYFTDRKRNAVLRLTTNGQIVEISGYGMHDYFRDRLSEVDTSGNSIVNKVVGGFDEHTKTYALSIQYSQNISELNNKDYTTTSFDESVQGWTSFYDYKPTLMASLNSSFYSFHLGKPWKHYKNTINQDNSFGNFYGQFYDSNVTVILNSNPSVVKNFKTINYEGAAGWELGSMIASSSPGYVGDSTLPIGAFVHATTMQALEDQLFSLNFKQKENKFFANLQQPVSVNAGQAGEVVWGADMSGLKGFWSTVKMKLNNSLTTNQNTKRELFSVASTTAESSY